MTDSVRIAFVCVQNAGRSQMATAFARRERAERGLDDVVEIVTGGTRPAEAVHDGVVATMREVGIDLSTSVPRQISDEELATCDHVATMGCSTLTLPDDVDARDWALGDPDGQPPARIREIRKEVRERVAKLFDDVEAELARPD